MTELTQDREAVLEQIAAKVPEPPQARVNERRDELEARLRSISPEVRAGEASALAELAEIEAGLAECDRDDLIAELAEAEEAERARVAAEEEAERQREAWRAELADIDRWRDEQLVKVERSLTALVDATLGAVALGLESDRLARLIDPNDRGVNLVRAIELRVARRLRDADLHDLDYPTGGLQGRTPLVAAAHDCAVCRHEQRAEIEAAVAGGETLQAVAERFGGFSKTTLSRHNTHR
jgi:hypothetical protein